MIFNPYMFFVVLSVGAGTLCAVLLCRKTGVGKQTIIYSIFMALFSAAIMSCWSVFIFSGGKQFGVSGLGGIGGILIGLVICIFIFKDHPSELISSWVVSAPLMYSISKIGCIKAGCCGGRLFGLPIQPVESAVFLMIFIISVSLFFIIKNKKISAFVAMLLSFIVRFSVEFGRLDHQAGKLSLNQILVLVGAGMATAVFLIGRRIYVNGKQ